MSNVSFSLTEKVIINPILGLRAPPLNTLDNPSTISGRICHFFLSEVVTRIITIATSFFAVIDSMFHLVSGIREAVYFGLSKQRRCTDSKVPNGEIIVHHFKHLAKFLAVAIIGSIAATIYPDVLKHFQISPFSLSEKGNTDWKNTSQTVQNLWNQTADRKTFEKLWNKAYLNDRRTFVHLLNENTSPKGMQAKLKLVSTVYKKISQPSDHWPKQRRGVFYHATSLQGLMGILKSGKVEVRHEKAYRGAFVSTKPETRFGKYILVFKRNIERLSKLNHGFIVNRAYWAGFYHDIPVNGATLSSILVHNGSHDEIANLEKNCQVWTDRKIAIKNLFNPDGINGDIDIPKSLFKIF